MQYVYAERISRRLYQRLQTAHDSTAAAIARELHDEIINITVRLNIEAIDRLRRQRSDPQLREELDLLLDGERAVSQMLRLVCEDLHPAGLDDPAGFPGVVQRHLERLQSTWRGVCRLDIIATPVPLAGDVRRELFRIVREALNNAIKHSNATEIIVRLWYPTPDCEQVQVRIRDNGRGTPAGCTRSGGLGMYYMRASAQAIGGTFAVHAAPGGGIEIAVAAHPLGRTRAARDGDDCVTKGIDV